MAAEGRKTIGKRLLEELSGQVLIFLGRDVKKYRPNVAAFVVDEKKNFLFCHRADITLKTEGFQLPQGWVELGESLEEALARELEEEISLSSFTVLGKTEKPIRYEWPEDNINYGSPYIGQEQTYFLIKVNSNEKKEIIPTKDFDFYRWVEIEVILSEVIDLKKSVYQQAFLELRHLIGS